MWSDGAVVRLLRSRERGDAGAPERFRKRLTVTRPLVDRLGLEAELHGHEGCVNCLEWSKDGSMLASASDDLRVILWDPFRRRRLRDIRTGHIQNIFSVKFVSEGRVATCAADFTVRVHDACACAGDAPQLLCVCHRARVKRLAVPHHDNNLLWSAGEDGLVLQHDLRAPHSCSSSERNVLVRLTCHAGRFAEAKCVAASPTRPHQLAVGANDFYVRLYDTRMIHLTAREGGGERRGREEDGVTQGAARYFAPGHLSTDADVQSFPKMATTYLSFSADGNELLVNMGSEQVYVFDVNHAPRPVLLESYIIQHNHGRADEHPPPHPHPHPPPHPHTMPDQVTAIKEAANKCVHGARYDEAVALYSDAIAACPRAAGAVLHSNRAAALLRRAWAGDVYAAVRDCYTAISLEPTHLKSHFRLAKALMELRRAREAHEVLLYFRRRFPQQASSHAVRLLARDIAVALDSSDSRSQHDSEEGGEACASALERALRGGAGDYSQRFLGHCNVTTDIKEASFLGDGYVAAGSDDGALLVWSRATGNLLRALRADDSILNCVQPHPALCLLATSGIESVVRLWAPRAEDGRREERAAQPERVAAANQLRMRADPFESMLLHASGPPELHALPCRPS